MNPRHPQQHRLLEFLLGTLLFTSGFALIVTFIGAPLGIPMFAAGLALLLGTAPEKS